jgi:hypothetical protein
MRNVPEVDTRRSALVYSVTNVIISCFYPYQYADNVFFRNRPNAAIPT